MQQTHRYQMGFTLVELVLVMLIVGITSFIVIPKFTKAVDSIKLDNARHKLADDIRRARHYAIDHHDTTWVIVNIDENNYGIYVGNTNNNLELITDPQTNSKHLINFDDADFEGVYLTDVDFNNTNRFYFNYWGEPSNNGTVTLNQTTVITVTENTGHVTIQD